MLIWDEVFESLKELNVYLNNCYSVRVFYANGEDKILRNDKMRIISILEDLIWLVERLEEE